MNIKLTIEVYRMIIVRLSSQLVELAYQTSNIEAFNKLFDEIQENKQRLDVLEREYFEQSKKIS